MLQFFNRKKATTSKNSRQKKYVQGPLVTVIIPLYNHEKYIRQAIESVLNQTYQTIELIIIDDGSSDNSVKVAKRFHDDRMQVLEQRNSGAHNTINRGLALAKGEYIAILNSDDVFEENRLETMIHYMEAHKTVGFTCSYITVINDKGKKLGIKEGWHNMEPWLLPHPDLSFNDKTDFKKNLFVSNFTSTTSNFLFRRAVYEKIGGMRNLHFVHDWDFALRAAEVTECRLIEQPLMQYRIHDSNTISSDRKWMLFEIAWIWAANLKRFYGKDIFTGNDGYWDLIKIAESLNLQGNDKILWLILMFIEAQEKNGIKHPEEILLDNHELRNKLLDYVIE